MTFCDLKDKIKNLFIEVKKPKRNFCANCQYYNKTAIDDICQHPESIVEFYDFITGKSTYEYNKCETVRTYWRANNYYNPNSCQYYKEKEEL